MSNFFALFDNFIEELYEDGTIDRWKREEAERKAKRKPSPTMYDRAAIMRSAWAYRKYDGLSMSDALKLAWADARRANLSMAA